MMREILFRGKRVDNGEWVEGCGIIATENWVSIFNVIDDIEENSSEVNEIEILPETVGQFTGLTDNNGRKIFEGDIVDYISSDVIGNPKTGTIIVDDITDYGTMVYLNHSGEVEVIGNIHDNPEIIKSANP